MIVPHQSFRYTCNKRNSLNHVGLGLFCYIDFVYLAPNKIDCYNKDVTRTKELQVMAKDYEFNALEVTEDSHIVINLPDNIAITIARGDIGYSVDFSNTDTSTIVEMGWVSDDDLDLIEDED